MKIKQRPEDFQVEELTDVVPGDTGSHSLYRMTKSGWTTLDAVAVVRKRWKIAPQRISYGGLKDRHALTSQYLTIANGPTRKLTHNDIHLEYLGQMLQKFESHHIRANRFQLTLRDLTPDRAEQAVAECETVSRDGLPNYFDDQRFGSVGADGQFIAREIVLGRYEEALRLALTAPYEFDRADAKKEKTVLRNHWGKWDECVNKLPRDPGRKWLTHLLHQPTDFTGALVRFRPALRGLYMSVYQSHLWNRILGSWLEAHFPSEQRLTVAGKVGALVMPSNLNEQQRNLCKSLEVPLPSGREILTDADPIYPFWKGVLDQENISAEQLRLKAVPREIFFSKGNRDAWFWPVALTAQAIPDEFHPGNHALELSFELPRGCYATLVAKRVMTDKT